MCAALLGAVGARALEPGGLEPCAGEPATAATGIETSVLPRTYVRIPGGRTCPFCVVVLGLFPVASCFFVMRCATVVAVCFYWEVGREVR